ncbi:MAG: hypothetical protein FJY86_01380 [Candidatus Diapherotrites archaeon]|uniref:Adenylate kinase n=1 Tax=Candidatus Iainarchaeum sp. TaxID=3101447 RepID=A0A8T4C6Q1_9ARCH|nr:hypothetical protein [Candidatus Diapherotrites archaeon]
MILVFIGPHGSGKGTIAQLFSRKGWVSFSMGQALREHVQRMGKYSQEVDRFLRAGKLVRNKVAYAVLHEHLSSLKKKNIIFDGFPRNVKQFRGARSILRLLKRDIDAFIFIDVPDSEVIARLKERKQCPRCQRIYGKNVSPRKKGFCNADGEKLVLRTDDNPAVIRDRFRVFYEETFPVMDEASKYYPVFRVNGVGSPTVVFKRVSRVVSLLN